MPFPKGHKFSPGRKFGQRNKRTIEMEIAQKELQQAILKNITPLTVAAMNSALGEKYLYRIKKGAKGGNLPPEIVTNPFEIQTALSAIADDAGLIDETYYYISTKPSNPQSFKELMDRAFGKSKEHIDMKVTGNVFLSTLSQRALDLRNKKKPSE